MRKIKFRGWERELQMMVYNTELGGWIFEYDGNPVRAVNQMINEEDYFYDLMQYTGLKDKNGTEIYEGDIVTNASTELIFQVVYKAPSFCRKWIDDVSKRYHDPIETMAWNTHIICEVIGNIYENPELLGDSQ